MFWQVVRDRKRPVAGAVNRISVRPSAESTSACAGRVKTGFILASQKILRQQPLRFRPNEDLPPLAVMLGLVAGGCVDPDFVASIDVDGPHGTGLLGTTASQSLEPHHVGHDLRHVQDRLFDNGIRDGSHGRLLPSVAAPFHETVHCVERTRDGFRHQFLGHAPAKDPFETGHLIVDVLPRVAAIDHFLANGAQRTWTELGDGLVFVVLPQVPQHDLVGSQFIGWIAVLDVPRLGVLPKGRDEFHDRNDGIGLGDGESSAVGEPLVDQPVVLTPAGGRAVRTEVEIFTVDADGGLPGRVPTVRRDSGLLGHVLHLCCGFKW